MFGQPCPVQFNIPEGLVEKKSDEKKEKKPKKKAAKKKPSKKKSV